MFLLVFELSLPLDELPLVLLDLCHALVVLFVLEPSECLRALNAREVPRLSALGLAVLVYLVFLEDGVASLTGEHDH